MLEELPFKLGSTSLTYPNLDLVENVKLADDAFDLIELTLDYPRSLPLEKDEVRKLNSIKEERGIEYTVHLPLSIRLSTPNPYLRQASIDAVAETYERAEALDPLVYTLHVTPMYMPGGSPLTHLFEIKQFEDQLGEARRSLEALKDYVDPGKIAVENLFTDLSRLQGYLDEAGYGRCFDVGHLVKRDKDPSLHYYEVADSVINVHLHGVVEGKDHQQIDGEADNFDLVSLFEVLADKAYRGPVVLEQFKPEHLNETLETMKSAWEEVRVK